MATLPAPRTDLADLLGDRPASGVGVRTRSAQRGADDVSTMRALRTRRRSGTGIRGADAVTIGRLSRDLESLAGAQSTETAFGRTFAVAPSGLRVPAAYAGRKLRRRPSTTASGTNTRTSRLSENLILLCTAHAATIELSDFADYWRVTGTIAAPRSVLLQPTVILTRRESLRFPYLAALLRATGWRVAERPVYDESLIWLPAMPRGACLGIGRRLRRRRRSSPGRRARTRTTRGVGCALTPPVLMPSRRRGGHAAPAPGAPNVGHRRGLRDGGAHHRARDGRSSLDLPPALHPPLAAHGAR